MNEKDFRRYAWLPVSALIIDPEYQRDEDPKWIATNALKFDADLFEPLCVSDRGDGEYAVIDGQHRLALAKRVGDEHVPCFVYEGLSREQESNLFRRFQAGRRALKPFEVFHAAFFEREDWAVDCNTLAEASGFRIGPIGDRDQTFVISGIRALQRVWGMAEHGHVLGVTLTTIAAGWQPGVRQRTDASLIEGLGSFIAKHQGQFDRDVLLGLMSGKGEGVVEQLTPSDLRTKAQRVRTAAATKRGTADGMGTRRWSVQYALEAEYNRAVPVGVKKLKVTRRPTRRDPVAVAA